MKEEMKEIRVQLGKIIESGADPLQVGILLGQLLIKLEQWINDESNT